MKMYLKTLATIGVAVLMFTGSAGAAGTSPWLEIDRIREHQSGYTWVHVKTSNIPTSCPNKHTFWISETNPNAEYMKRLVTAAFLAGRQIRVGATDNCTPSNDIVDWIDMR